MIFGLLVVNMVGVLGKVKWVRVYMVLVFVEVVGVGRGGYWFFK